MLGHYIFLQLLFAPKAKELLDSTFDSMGKFSSHFFETIRSNRLIKIGQLEEVRLSQWKELYYQYLDADLKREGVLTVSRNLQELITNLEFILSFFVGTLLVINGQLSMGMFFAFVAFRQRFITSSKLLVDALLQMQMLDVNLNRLSDIVLAPVDDTLYEPSPGKVHAVVASAADGANFPERGDFVWEMQVNNLSFRYPDSSYIFRYLDLCFKPGETIAIVGPSGSGKTTLLLCLMGLLKPESGEILLDGKSIFKIPHYRQLATAVMQDDHLLTGSIRENICSFAAECDLARLHDCAQLAQIHDEIMRMPQGYDSIIYDMGAGLSGGQKQRIIIARALYRKPKILFWDEAASQIDLQNEARINANIKKMGISRVIVSHRPQSTDDVDQIIDLSQVTGSPSVRRA